MLRVLLQLVRPFVRSRNPVPKLSPFLGVVFSLSVCTDSVEQQKHASTGADWNFMVQKNVDALFIWVLLAKGFLWFSSRIGPVALKPGELPGMPAASTLLTTGSIASLEPIMMTRTTSLSASTATSLAGLRGMIQSRATCAGLGHRTVRKIPGEGFFGGWQKV